MSWTSDDLPLINAASSQFVKIIVDRLTDEQGVHIETAISAAGGVAGVSIIRSAAAYEKIDLSKLIKERPGDYLLIETATEIGAEVSNFMKTFCKAWGVDPHTGWTMTIPEKHQSLKSLTDLVRDFEKPFNELMVEQAIQQDLQPFTAALAAVNLIVMGEQVVHPDIGKAIALMAIAATSKTVPYD